MEVIIQKNAEAASQLVANLVLKKINANPASVLGLATGRTMERVYSILVEAYKRKEVSFSNVTSFNLDEYIGLSKEHSQSYRTFMNTHLFDKIDIKKDKTFLPQGDAADLDSECELYEGKIKASGGIDLQLLGLGKVGHIGFNEPLSSLSSRTRAKSLSPETRAQNSELFGSLEAVPSRAITMGVGTILESKRCIMLVTGASKAEIVAKAVEGPITSVVSATALQMHARCTVIVDEEAATKLQHQAYYRWVFNNEPEWAEYR